MKVYPAIPGRSWIWTSLLLVMFAVVFERALDSVDKWLSTQSSIYLLALFLTPIALGLAGSTADASFMRKFGSGIAIRKRLGPIYGGTLVVWMILSMAVRIAISGAHPFSSANFSGFLMIATIVLCQTLAGSGLAWAAVVWFGRKQKGGVVVPHSVTGTS